MSRRSSSRPTRRDAVHSELTALLAPGGPLAAPPRNVTAYLTNALILDVAHEYRATTPSGDEEGHAVILTAGPPGAGKSTALASLSTGYRRIDPDDLKQLILSRLEHDGRLAPRHHHVLADGKPVSPAELAGWVHQASTAAADQVRAASLIQGENFVMEGTLGWERLPEVYRTELADHFYEHLTIVDVEVPLDLALDQARRRWWNGRTDSAAPLGGRFVSDAVIEAFYPQTPSISICASRAREMYAAAEQEEISTDLRSVTRSATGKVRTASINARGVWEWNVLGLTPNPSPAVPCVRCGTLLTSSKSIRRGLGDDCAHLV